MKVMSLAQEGATLKPVEVELILATGLPQIHFLGLPDQVIKESIHRIKSAIREQGFTFPNAKQVLVNIRPHHIKKTSRGVELAVAAALLWETEQIRKPLDQQNYFVYGELGLDGEVFQPEDLKDFVAPVETVVLTGASDQPATFQRQALKNLRDLHQPQGVPADPKAFEPVRPLEGLQLSFPKSQARLLQILALGGHHVLLAGPSGAGKSTLAKALVSFLEEPSSRSPGKTWRPLVAPHHSLTALSLIGGGVPPKPGEITEADGGILLMDELLEFSLSVQEALREPIEEGRIRISRGLQRETFPCRFQLVATTNLCPCGDWLPGKSVSCRFSRHRCQSYQQKLSGPFLDRFEILYFATATASADINASVPGTEILETVEQARQWRLSLKAPPVDRFDNFVRKNIWPKEFSSRRRQKASFAVAISIADLEMSEKVKPHHVDEALSLTYHPFEKLSRCF